MVCKTPMAGQSKTRLSPPLSPEECARLSACFIRDSAATIHSACADRKATPYALYTPVGSEPALRPLLAPTFRPLAQRGDGLGERLILAAEDLFAAGHEGFVLVNSDSP